MLSKDEVTRHVSQIFCLERLAASDIPMARSLLSALVQVCFNCLSALQEPSLKGLHVSANSRQPAACSQHWCRYSLGASLHRRILL